MQRGCVKALQHCKHWKILTRSNLNLFTHLSCRFLLTCIFFCKHNKNTLDKLFLLFNLLTSFENLWSFFSFIYIEHYHFHIKKLSLWFLYQYQNSKPCSWHRPIYPKLLVLTKRVPQSSIDIDVTSRFKIRRYFNHIYRPHLSSSSLNTQL